MGCGSYKNLCYYLVVGPVFDEVKVRDFVLFFISQMRETFGRKVVNRPTSDKLSPIPKDDYGLFDQFLEVLPDMLHRFEHCNIQSNLLGTIVALAESQAEWIERDFQKWVPPFYALGRDEFFLWTTLIHAQRNDGKNLTEADK